MISSEETGQSSPPQQAKRARGKEVEWLRQTQACLQVRQTCNQATEDEEEEEGPDSSPTAAPASEAQALGASWKAPYVAFQGREW